MHTDVGRSSCKYNIQQGNRRWQTLPPVPHSGKLYQTQYTAVVWRLTGTTTWRTSSKYNVMFDSGLLAQWYKIWSHPQNQKYVTYRNAVNEGWSHGPTEACKKNLVKFGRVVFELCEQTNRQTDRLITILCASAGGEVTINSRQKIAHESNLRWSSGNSLNNRKFSNAIVQHMTKSPFLQTK